MTRPARLSPMQRRLARRGARKDACSIWQQLAREGTARHHRALEALCDRLERFADTLPRPAALEAAALARLAPRVIGEAHRFEELWMLPRLSPPLRRRLRAEHIEDESYAEDLAAGLARLARAPDPQAQAEEVGWMLRGLFTGLRRHMAAERDLIAALKE